MPDQPAETTETAAPAAPAEAAQPKQVDWEAEAKKWEKRSKDNYAKLQEAAPKLAEYEQMRQSQLTDQQRQSEELTRWQSEAERWRSASIGSKIEALAAPDFEFPADAVGQLDASKYLDAGGVIDEAAIKSDLADLLQRRPNWARQQPNQTLATPRLPAPNSAQGTSGKAAPNSPAEQLASILQAQLKGP